VRTTRVDRVRTRVDRVRTGGGSEAVWHRSEVCIRAPWDGPPHAGLCVLIVPLFRGSSRFESLILSQHSRKVACECNEEDEAELLSWSERVGGCHAAPPPWHTIFLAQANHPRLTVPLLECRFHARVQDAYESHSRYVRNPKRNVTNPHENPPQVLQSHL